ncbi:hypothetical protein V1514DRAFT_23016 [Lipomyces japonicus]|uniref:uncharacterized protein n=1 Tax=Lipomyces japonicus TaxID=56871 RepID=UPI0034CFB0C6
MELQSADDVRTVLATPLAVESLNLSLTARRLATTAEMARLQVLHLRDVPLLLTSEVALATFGPSVAPFGEIVELQRDINPRYPLVHNGKYRLVVRLADVRKPMPHALTITHKGVLTTIPVRFDPKANIGGCYFCHSPLHARQNCTVAPQCFHCGSRGHHSKRCPSRPRTSSPSPTPGETSTAESAARTTSTSSATVIGDLPTPTESCSASSEPGTPPDQTALPSATVPTVRALYPVKIPRPTRKPPVQLPPDTTLATSARSPTRGRSTVSKRQASRTPPPGPPPSSASPRRRVSASPHKLVRINATLPPVLDPPGEEPNQPATI